MALKTMIGYIAHVWIFAIIACPALVLLFGCNGDRESGAREAEITIVLKTNYTPYLPESVRIEHNFNDDWRKTSMEKVSSTSWSYKGMVKTGHPYIFNIISHFELSNNLQCYKDSWVIKEGGIDATSLELNGKTIDNSYLVKTDGQWPNISFLISAQGDIQHAGSNQIIVDDRIPSGGGWSKGYFKYPLPPSGFEAGCAWLQAIHDERNSEESKVEVDWVNIYCNVNGVAQLLQSDNFNDTFGGGLATRYPWFLVDVDESMPAIIEPAGVLSMKPSERMDRIWFLWNTSRAKIPDNAERCWMEARVRISGPALVQTGLDWHQNLTSISSTYTIKEAGASNWFFADSEWQIISVGK